jgi:hypothetical protein
LELLVVPLRSVLAAGADDGSFHGIDPDADALHLSALAWEMAARLRHATSRQERDELRESLLSFAQRGLGAVRLQTGFPNDHHG